MFVVVRISDGKFVAVSGSDQSFTADLTEAAVYKTAAVAAKNCCGDERVVAVTDIINKPE